MQRIILMKVQEKNIIHHQDLMDNKIVDQHSLNLNLKVINNHLLIFLQKN